MEGKKKTKKGVKYFLIFILFLAIGIFLGVFGALKYLENKDKEQIELKEEIVNNEPEDITDNEELQSTITTLHNIVNNNSIFYSTKGITAENISNNDKLIYIYSNLYQNKKGEASSLTQKEYGSSNCEYDFLLDNDTNLFGLDNKCTTTEYNIDFFKEVNKNTFNSDTLDTTKEFAPENNIKCVSSDNKYICGKVANTSGITGKLEPKFEITKVTRDDDFTITIYDKGYLVDKRSNVIANKEHDNYYLHSSDSKEYYYELKSADNLTFKHTFKTTDRKNYYYVSSELVE